VSNVYNFYRISQCIAYYYKASRYNWAIGIFTFQVQVFWVVLPCSIAVGHQRFEGPCCHHILILPWRERQEGSPKQR